MALTLAAPESMIGNSGFVSQGGLGMSCAADALFRQAVPSENVDVWAQDHGLVEAVRTAFEATLRQQPQEPISYLARCLLMLAASKGEVISSAEQELLKKENKKDKEKEVLLVQVQVQVLAPPMISCHLPLFLFLFLSGGPTSQLSQSATLPTLSPQCGSGSSSHLERATAHERQSPPDAEVPLTDASHPHLVGAEPEADRLPPPLPAFFPQDPWEARSEASVASAVPLHLQRALEEEGALARQLAGNLAAAVSGLLPAKSMPATAANAANAANAAAEGRWASSSSGDMDMHSENSGWSQRVGGDPFSVDELLSQGRRSGTSTASLASASSAATSTNPEVLGQAHAGVVVTVSPPGPYGTSHHGGHAAGGDGGALKARRRRSGQPVLKAVAEESLREIVEAEMQQLRLRHQARSQPDDAFRSLSSEGPDFLACSSSPSRIPSSVFCDTNNTTNNNNNNTNNNRHDTGYAHGQSLGHGPGKVSSIGGLMGFTLPAPEAYDCSASSAAISVIGPFPNGASATVSISDEDDAHVLTGAAGSSYASAINAAGLQACSSAIRQDSSALEDFGDGAASSALPSLKEILSYEGLPVNVSAHSCN
eukprot:CAMPEP_0206452396 /NCGR_PEP_ID=MMETSP0324_2-20121206/19922_1 /ASSEMBLY_ACC=CAM_ASM_000836 /TAXON_ID=2866 /ORGANISM="Crypthecodinium cohnii, Strain Seligo" /LENGTH=596 /DNA_ID=CAMNT_0053922481 /DNA_START=134 /DNA_END=1925 /DNA_ORIENTATION=-